MSGNVFRKLDEELSKLRDEFPDINRGGCGFTAMYIGEEMEKRGYKVKYILIGDKVKYDTSLESFRAFRDLPEDTKLSIFDTYSNGFTIGHIMVYHKSIVLDPTGVSSWENCRWNTRFKLITATLTRDIIDHWLCQDGWNDCFKRKDLPRIKERIQEIFNKTFNQ